MARTKTTSKWCPITPKSIYKQLENHIVGQDHAKKALSVGIYNHYKRIGEKNLGKHNDADPGLTQILEPFVGVDKSNGGTIAKSDLILIGPTGCGKTKLVRTVAKYLHVPCVIYDCTSLMGAGSGYDDNVEQILTELYLDADQHVAKAEIGIVFLDQVDKIRFSVESTTDVCGRRVQQDLLTMLEGTKILVPKTLIANCEDKVQIDTSNILFIAMGCFDGLDAIVRERLRKELKNNSNSTWLDHIEPCDLIEYRMMPELVERFPVIVPVKPIDEQTLVNILALPNSILSHYEKLFRMDNVELFFSEDAIAEIARVTVEKKIGLRGLRARLENILQNSMFEVPQSDIDQVIVTRNAVLQKEQVQYKRRKTG